MNVLVVGSGGREHAICWKLQSESGIEKIYCAPGNAGISTVANCVDIKDDDIFALKTFAKENEIDLTIVGPEVPLVKGIVDEFEKDNLKIFGPNSQCAKLEGSKAFSKSFMIKYNIPTAKYKEFNNIENAINEISTFGFPVVIKADGLASGKGVIIAESEDVAIKTLKEMMIEHKFASAGDKVIIEEFLCGVETSILAFVDNNTIVPMVSAKDHKKVFDSDKGLNTGGMGTFSPSEIYTEKIAEEVNKNILQKTLEGFKKEGLHYKGILFVGLMITKDGAKVLEYNVRFGDPETQSVLFRLKTDLHKILNAIIDNKLSEINIEYTNESAICVMLTSGGYPESYEKGKVITGLENLDKDIVAFHSGTKFDGDKIVTNGGRVIGITAKGSNVKEASEKAYKNISKIHFDKMHYRLDIWK